MWTKVIALSATALGALVTASACGAYDEGVDEDVGIATDELERDAGDALAIDPPEGEGASKARGKGCPETALRDYLSRDPAVCEGIKIKCPAGNFLFSDERGCGCRRPCPAGGEACGSNVCAAGMECCNASCGICVRPGGACIQIACEAPGSLE